MRSKRRLKDWDIQPDNCPCIISETLNVSCRSQKKEFRQFNKLIAEQVSSMTKNGYTANQASGDPAVVMG